MVIKISRQTVRIVELAGMYVLLSVVLLWRRCIGIGIGIYLHSINLYKRCGNSHNYNE